MNDQTTTQCNAIDERRDIIMYLRRILDPYHATDAEPAQGTEAELNEVFVYLKGVIAEYQDGGDQMVEGCACGEHIA